ncbi:MAG: M23 family metallopeptidase [Gammaproteobacteria bacterium]|nr:M23 family metallopeptidase [Gammaproteobacteria bacterium]
MDALAVRVAQIQAQVMRIEGLGQRLVDLADLDRGEFNFGQVPAQGGPVEATVLENPAPTDFMQALEELSTQIKDRERQLIVLEDIFQGRGLSLQGHPAGSPVAEGWLSSFFGVRTDPFTGRPAMHEGLDFAGKLGSPVVAVAAGSVVWSGPRDGYGNLVEVDHGHGFVTRYGHNSRNLVRVGQLVRKGQQIARMGSSGRSTGPHVHFEVLPCLSANRRAVAVSCVPSRATPHS